MATSRRPDMIEHGAKAFGDRQHADQHGDDAGDADERDDGRASARCDMLRRFIDVMAAICARRHCRPSQLLILASASTIFRRDACAHGKRRGQRAEHDDEYGADRVRRSAACRAPGRTAATACRCASTTSAASPRPMAPPSAVTSRASPSTIPVTPALGEAERLHHADFVECARGSTAPWCWPSPAAW